MSDSTKSVENRFELLEHIYTINRLCSHDSVTHAATRTQTVLTSSFEWVKNYNLVLVLQADALSKLFSVGHRDNTLQDPHSAVTSKQEMLIYIHSLENRII